VNKKKQQRQASVEGLLRAALHLFVSRGYRSTNLEQIAGAAKLSKGSVYFYFGSKEAVLLELLKRVQAIVVDQALAAARQAGPGAADRIVAFLHHQAQLGVTHRDEVLLLILMSLEYKERQGEVNDFIAGLQRKQRRLIEGLIADGQKAGTIRADVPARELAAIVLATNDGTFLEWFRRSSSLRGRELTRALRVVLLSGATLP